MNGCAVIHCKKILIFASKIKIEPCMAGADATEYIRLVFMFTVYRCDGYIRNRLGFHAETLNWDSALLVQCTYV